MSADPAPGPLAQINPASHLTTLPLGQLQKLGHALYLTGFLPATIKNGDQAMAVMLKGQELRIPPMYALSNIVVINGKPTCGAELMLALIYRDHGDQAVRFERTDAEACTISYKRRGWTERREHTFTIADAQRAGLSSGTWKAYPGPLLRARCVSAVARMAFPDTIGGMYTAEELGAAVDVDQATGELVTIEAPARPAPVARPARPAPAPAPEPVSPAAISIGRAAPADQGAPPPDDDGYFTALDAEAAPAAPAPAQTAAPAALPPTQTQLDTIAKLARSTGEAVTTGALNRAQASDLITRLSEKRYGQRPAPSAAGGDRPASAEQLKFLGELSNKVGEPVPEGLTLQAARDLITDWKGQVESLRAAEKAVREPAGAGK